MPGHRFKPGHQKFGGRKTGGSKAQINLRNAILGALEAVNGVEYLINVAKKDPRTFCALLGRVLPLQIAGDAANPIRYQVTLSFGRDDEALAGNTLQLEAADADEPHRIN